MNTLKAAICASIVADATFQTLTGQTPILPRLFKAWPPEEPDISTLQPGYAVYAFSTQAGATEANGEQDGDIMLTFDIYAKSEDRTTNIRECLKDLLHKTSFSSESIRTLTVIYNGSNHFFETDRRLHHESSMFTITNLFQAS